MKKVISIVLVCLLAMIVLVSCGKEDPGVSVPDEPVPAQDGTGFGTDNNASATKDNNAPATQNDPAQTAGDFDSSRVIAVFTREDGSGTRDAFVSLTGVGDDMYVEAVVESETNQILSKVEENNYAIGYVSVGSLNPNVKALDIDGVTPSNATILDGSYKLSRPFLICMNEDNIDNALVKDFLSFILSVEGQEVVGTKWTKLDNNAVAYASGGLSGTLKVGGSTSVEPLMQSLSQAYKALNPSVDIEISGGGSGTGISEATNGVLNIGMSSRALKDNEKEALTGYQIALDGVAVIVNPANPISALTIDQVREIFVGEVTRWAAAG